MNKDQVKGRAKEAKGKVKEVVCKATGNETTKPSPPGLNKTDTRN